MSRYRPRIALWEPSSKAVMGLAISFAVSACVTGGQEATLASPQAPTAERPTRSAARLMGRWGVRRFRQKKDL